MDDDKLLDYYQNNGFAIVEDIYTDDEIAGIVKLIDDTDHANSDFRKTKDLFAIRQFLKEIPGVKNLVFNKNLTSLIKNLFGADYFITKSIYFDKPENSNWFVAWHQDLTIAVEKKVEMQGYGPWTVKSDQFAVQPPLDVLKDNFTIRIHLDDTDEYNGGLKVVPASQKNILRAENIDWQNEQVYVCKVKKCGINVMHPLIMHASQRSVTGKKRRVVHIEFSKSKLPKGITWAEKEYY